MGFKLILDTHILIKLVNGDPLPEAITSRLQVNADRAISAMTAWEVFMLEKYKKVSFSIPAAAWLGRALNLFNIETIPLSIPIIHKANRLKWEHRDPADRFIVATALERGTELATLDKIILESKIVDTL